MAASGPVLIIEDDPNDADVIATATRELGIKNEIKVFAAAKDALDYLLVTRDKPMVIICDMRMPVLDGLSFLKQICANDYLKLKAIPFVFLAGTYTTKMVNEAYRIGVQGFYQKAGSYEKIKAQLYAIFLYWHGCIHPAPDVDAAGQDGQE